MLDWNIFFIIANAKLEYLKALCMEEILYSDDDLAEIDAYLESGFTDI